MSLLMRRRMLIANSEKGLLPSAYQQVEYIENEVGAYIDTGVLPNENVSFESKAQVVSVGSNHLALWGSRTINSSARQGNFLIFLKNTATQWYYGNLTKHAVLQGTFFDAHIYKTEKNKFYRDDVLTYTIDEAQFSNAYNIYIFCCNTAKKYIDFKDGSAKVFYFKILENDVLVRDFIPCYRKSDGVIGMYDLVENKFYTNKGTGTFLKGADI